MKRLLPIFAVLAFLILPQAAATADQLRDLKVGAAYIASLNELVSQAGEILNETSRYDDLVYGLIENDVTPEFAERQLQQISATQRLKLKRLKNAVDSLPPPPQGITTPQIKNSIRLVQDMLRTSLETAESEIIGGENFVSAALGGDLDVLAKVERKGLERILGSITRDSGLIQLEKANQKYGTPVYYLYGAIGAGYDSLMAFMKTSLSVKDNLTLALQDQDLEMLQTARRSLDSGFKNIRDGERSSQQLLGQVRVMPVNTSTARANRAILKEALSTLPESFDIERRYLSLIEVLIDEAVRTNFNAASDFLSDFQIKPVILDQERMRLMINRQKLIATMQ